jgi:hypothetical protein
VEESRLGYWLKRAGAALVISLLIGLLIGAFRGSSVIAGDLLTPGTRPPGPQFEVELVGAGRIKLPRSDTTERVGIWGVTNEEGAYGQMAAVITRDAESVERSFRTLSGRFIAGDLVRFDDYAVGYDPFEAFAIEYEEVRVPGQLGVNPAWLVPGERDTWVILIHGEGLDERAQALRILPVIEEAGYPVLIITYRNDSAAPDDGSYYRWGLTEWRDVEAAISFVRNRDPDDDSAKFVLFGYGMGGNIAMTHLHESDSTSDVLGVVLDSPVLDLGAVVDRLDDERNIPALISSAAKAVARVRFGLEWSQLDQTHRVDQFDVPILLIQGMEDEMLPIETTEAFANALPNLVTHETFEGAGRTEAWNVDAERYNEAVAEFLTRITEEAP